MQRNLQLPCVSKKKNQQVGERTMFLQSINITQAYFCMRQSQPCLNFPFLSWPYKNRIASFQMFSWLGGKHMKTKRPAHARQRFPRKNRKTCASFSEIQISHVNVSQFASQTKHYARRFEFSSFFSGWFASTLCLCFIKASLYSSWQLCYLRVFLFLPAPEGSKHNPLSCVLLNQQLKVPVTMFTVLKRIWPVSNTTWKDFKDG